MIVKPYNPLILSLKFQSMDPTLHCNAVRCRSGKDLFAVGRVDGASSQVAGSDSAEGCAAGVGQVSTLEAPGVATGLASGERPSGFAQPVPW